jgi:hypothetical protein
VTRALVEGDVGDQMQNKLEHMVAARAHVTATGFFFLSSPLGSFGSPTFLTLDTFGPSQGFKLTDFAQDLLLHVVVVWHFSLSENFSAREHFRNPLQSRSSHRFVSFPLDGTFPRRVFALSSEINSIYSLKHNQLTARRRGLFSSGRTAEL